MVKKIDEGKILEYYVKQLNTYGNGIGVLITRDIQSIGLKSGDKVKARSVEIDGKKMIIIELYEKNLL